MNLSGVISDRLRKIFTPDDKAWNPGRPESPTSSTVTPKGVDGKSLGGRNKK